MGEKVLIVECDGRAGGGQCLGPWIRFECQEERQPGVRFGEPGSQLDRTAQFLDRAGHVPLAGLTEREREVVMGQGIRWTKRYRGSAPADGLDPRLVVGC